MFALEAIVSGISYLSLALSAGMLLAAGFFLTEPEDRDLRARLARGFAVTACASLLIGIALFLVQGAKLNSGRFPTWDILSRYASRTQSGNIWLARELYLLIVLLIGLSFCRLKVKSKQMRLLFFLLLPWIASRGLTGHAASVRENRPNMLFADALHVTAVALWAGGLPVLFWLLRQNSSVTPTWRIVRRFSAVALASVALLVAAGIYQLFTHVGTLSALLNTNYGQMLSVKLALFVLMLGFGAVNFFSFRRLRALANTGRNHMTKQKHCYRIGCESLIGFAVLLVAGFLTTLPPAVHRSHGQTRSATDEAKHTHGLPAAKARAEGAAVTILAPQPDKIFTGDRVAIEFRLTKGKRGHHVHAYVDGELMGMFQSEKGTLTGIRTGRHVLELRVVAADHQTELDASDYVEFTVK